MSFINIFKDTGEEATIPETAYEQIYKRHGWKKGKLSQDTGFVLENDEEYEEIPDLDRMNITKLKELAEEYDIDLSGLTTKAEIKEKIESELYE